MKQINKLGYMLVTADSQKLTAYKIPDYFKRIKPKNSKLNRAELHTTYALSDEF